MISLFSLEGEIQQDALCGEVKMKMPFVFCFRCVVQARLVSITTENILTDGELGISLNTHTSKLLRKIYF